MAVKCSVKIAGDYAHVQAVDSPTRSLRFDVSKTGCRLYENTRQQSKDFFEEIVNWCGEIPANADAVSKMLQMYLLTRRRELGLPA